VSILVGLLLDCIITWMIASLAATRQTKKVLNARISTLGQGDVKNYHKMRDFLMRLQYRDDLTPILSAAEKAEVNSMLNTYDNTKEITK